MLRQELLFALVFLSFAGLQCAKNPVKEEYLEPPFNLVADSGLEGKVYLTWQAPKAGGETGYRLYRKKSGDSYSSIATIGEMPQPEYTDITVTNDLIYYYAVTTLYPQGESEYSNQDWALPGENQPPWIESVTINPSSIDSTAQDTIYIYTQVNDYQGWGDVINVRFHSYIPSGEEAKESPFYLFNDGGRDPYSGDKVEDDNVFSMMIPFPPDTFWVGTYTWVFIAKDRSGLESLPDTLYFIINPK